MKSKHIGPLKELRGDPAIIVGVCYGPLAYLIALMVAVCAHLAAGGNIVNSGIAAGS